MSRLDALLKKIKKTCESHDLLYSLEKIIGEDDGARIGAVYVHPDNKLRYSMERMGMPRAGDQTDPVESKAVVIVGSDKDGYKLVSFEITKDDGSKVLEHLRTDIASVIHNTSVEKLHDVIPDERHAAMVQMYNENTPLKDIKDHFGYKDWRSVSNLMRELRREYGEDVVLTNEERKRRAESSW
jgi:hypothetical protein